MVLKAYAKLNLGLQVLHKRPDGFHEIATHFAGISLHDTITVAPSHELKCSCEPEVTADIEGNLVTKAFRAFAEEFAVPVTYHVHIEKVIPTGAGLGGGSSDSATTLNFLRLNTQSSHHADIDARVFSIAENLGSDVPFLLNPRRAFGTSRGEKLLYFPSPIREGKKILLVLPDLRLNTAQAFSSLKRSSDETTQSNLYPGDLASLSLESWKDVLFNDFEVVAFERHPILATIKNQLYQNGAKYSQMSGSGSALFGIFDDEVKATKARTYFSDLRTELADFLF